MKDEQFYMQHALELARLTIGQTRPNPSVGAVIIKDGVVVGTGTHLVPGQPHAEVYALEQAGEQAKGATMFVTLEPCSHYGQTPPCAKAIIDAGIEKVYVATLDPNPKVAGNGVKWLRDEGVEVEVGLLEQEAQLINQKFFHFMTYKKPFVTLKTAVSMDGKTSANSGDSKWITSEEARHDVHTQRHQHDAILVGSQTVLRDDPHLTTRLPHGGLNPTRIVLDTHLAIPLDTHVLTDQQANTIVVCGKQADEDQEAQFNALNHVSVWRMDTDQIDLEILLSRLAEAKLMSVYVEGGATIHSDFIQHQLFDEIHLYMAPKLIGGELSKVFYNQLGFDYVADAVNVTFHSVDMIGPDIKVVAKPQHEEDA
ncbi:bifunctional diaminohydroxyphosphoribosylaminopyrimidine deaminase/5-amino-6-(5-phosphoribosylamino)uracil reductase RibD [Alkalibacillus almallahensis]|uniref:bifunctional diaminohydroxyphosphoribosylaminopyrimidine deaminase/5-amino-6-(5-phosphoribosylamino)uracil reductase RibD n=1 Tax=Alkalibacillus almallahensis TaxID=1379154 RepID=UPI002443D940|nr:bifunctional diaminohydroxyphosphoribosylaminopyrimidine deaminase/5-amino-6-(5-phosphoribosylamino)uracil reductase RibD [Alkalibacillus almallahensis]NIK12156.1 diaminohydroxyphosphoribosylaminopyrimidine deaminase/5-amino-6-(5-phosphoribosylamino)uracil reductase [Alkalibacillus almallahensis]